MNKKWIFRYRSYLFRMYAFRIRHDDIDNFSVSYSHAHRGGRRANEHRPIITPRHSNNSDVRIVLNAMAAHVNQTYTNHSWTHFRGTNLLFHNRMYTFERLERYYFEGCTHNDGESSFVYAVRCDIIELKESKKTNLLRKLFEIF